MRRRRFYTAATFGSRHALLPFVKQLEQRGHTVTSQWLHESDDRPVELTIYEDAKFCADRDLGDIDAADILIFFVDGDSHGKWVELGYATARAKIVWIVGPEPDPNDRLSGRSIFARALPTRRFRSTDEVLRALDDYV